MHRLNENPFPQRLNGGADLMLDYLGPEMPLANRFAIANQWLFSPLIMRKLGAKPAGNATLRTTLALTIIAGGFKETVLPTNAEVTVNVRILPGDSVASVMDRMHQVVNDDRVLIKCDTSVREPSRISSTESKAFKRLHTTIKEVFPDTLVAPFVVVAGTDSSHFDKDSLRKDVYRFLPSRLGEKDLSRLHGINERISKSNYLEIVRFFTQLIENTSEGAKPPLSGA